MSRYHQLPPIHTCRSVHVCMIVLILLYKYSAEGVKLYNDIVQQYVPVALHWHLRSFWLAVDCRVATQAEKQQAATKDTKQLRQYEENLLHNYKLYLQLLEECIGQSGVAGQTPGTHLLCVY